MARVDNNTALRNMPLEPISSLAPFSALIMSMMLIILFLIRYYILEDLLIPQIYGPGTTKIGILIIAAYPFISVISGESTLKSPYTRGSIVILGDILVVAAQLLIAMYVFELIYRVKLSLIAVLHHIGTILIGQEAIAISLRLVREPDADIEFILCTVWGAFDIISEFFPHVAIILYRIFPNRHVFLKRVFLLSCITTATGTTCETIVTMYLFGSLWPRWQISFKVVTPILHVAFSAAQIHGSIVLWKMYRKQCLYAEAPVPVEEAGA